MSTNRSCKTAKDSRGAKIRVGDRVTAISLHDGNPMNTGTVIEMWRQGYDGTILKLDVPPDPQYPHHWLHQASKTIKVAWPPTTKTLHARLRALHCISCYDMMKEQPKQSPCTCACHKPRTT